MELMTDECTAREVLDRVGGKWSIAIIVAAAQGPVRFTELERSIDGISRRMLALTLRNLERDGLLHPHRLRDRPAQGRVRRHRPGPGDLRRAGHADHLGRAAPRRDHRRPGRLRPRVGVERPPRDEPGTGRRLLAVRRAVLCGAGVRRGPSTSPSTSRPGQPCPNLGGDFRCGIHRDLRAKGFRGCTVYDCFGAGQHLTQDDLRRRRLARPAGAGRVDVRRLPGDAGAARAALVPDRGAGAGAAGGAARRAARRRRADDRRLTGGSARGAGRARRGAALGRRQRPAGAGQRRRARRPRPARAGSAAAPTSSARTCGAPTCGRPTCGVPI